MDESALPLGDKADADVRTVFSFSRKSRKQRRYNTTVRTTAVAAAVAAVPVTGTESSLGSVVEHFDGSNYNRGGIASLHSCDSNNGDKEEEEEDSIHGTAVAMDALERAKRVVWFHFLVFATAFVFNAWLYRAGGLQTWDMVIWFFGALYFAYIYTICFSRQYWSTLAGVVGCFAVNGWLMYRLLFTHSAKELCVYQWRGGDGVDYACHQVPSVLFYVLLVAYNAIYCILSNPAFFASTAFAASATVPRSSL